MIEIARLDKRKALLRCALLLAASAYILSQPISAPGGLTALLENRDGYRGYWPVAAIAALVLVPMVIASAMRTARWALPAVFLTDNRVHAFGWKKPVPLAEVDHVLLERPKFFSMSQGQPYIVLKSGDRVRLPYDHVGEPYALLKRLAAALGVSLIEPPPR